MPPSDGAVYSERMRHYTSMWHAFHCGGFHRVFTLVIISIWDAFKILPRNLSHSLRLLVISATSDHCIWATKWQESVRKRKFNISQNWAFIIHTHLVPICTRTEYPILSAPRLFFLSPDSEPHISCLSSRITFDLSFKLAAVKKIW